MVSQIRDIPSEVDALLGSKFIFMPRRSIAAAHTGHGVIFGIYDGQEVAVKPFYGKHADDKALNEERMTRVVRDLGFSTLEPAGIVKGKGMAVFMTSYVTGLVGGNALPLEASPSSRAGQRTAEAMTGIATTLAHLNSEFVTHGDPQTKNFGFSMAGNMPQPSLIFDLEKSTSHSRTSVFMAGALKREVKRLAYSLGAQVYGGPDRQLAHAHLHETVIDPYTDSLGKTLLRDIQLLPIISTAERAFDEARVRAFRAADMQLSPDVPMVMTPTEAS